MIEQSFDQHQKLKTIEWTANSNSSLLQNTQWTGLPSHIASVWIPGHRFAAAKVQQTPKVLRVKPDLCFTCHLFPQIGKSSVMRNCINSYTHMYVYEKELCNKHICVLYNIISLCCYWLLAIFTRVFVANPPQSASQNGYVLLRSQLSNFALRSSDKAWPQHLKSWSKHLFCSCQRCQALCSLKRWHHYFGRISMGFEWISMDFNGFHVWITLKAAVISRDTKRWLSVAPSPSIASSRVASVLALPAAQCLEIPRFRIFPRGCQVPRPGRNKSAQNGCECSQQSLRLNFCRKNKLHRPHQLCHSAFGAIRWKWVFIWEF